MMDDPITLISVLREPVPLLLRFIAWHRRQGVTHFILYFDDPDDPAIPLLAGEADVTCIACTPAFWAGLNRAPQDRFVKRQITALTHGYRQVHKGWVAVADGDELFHVPEGGLPAIVAGVPADVPVLRILPAEVVQTEDGALSFRMQVRPRVADQVYGDAAFLVRRNGGLVGHVQGKSLTRAGLGAQIAVVRQHFPVTAKWARLPEVKAGAAQGAYLLHFFDRGYDSWRDKLAWRVRAWGMPKALIEALKPLVEALEAGGASAVEADATLRLHYRALHHCDARRLKRLDRAGALFQLGCDPMGPAREDFPGLVGLQG